VRVRRRALNRSRLAVVRLLVDALMAVSDYFTADLPTVAEIDAARAGQPVLKGKTRLEVTAEQRPLTKVTDKAFRAEVWKRDLSCCRCCGRKVLKTLARVPERGEVHHLHGRTGDLRFEAKAAVLVCARDHERLTGKVNAHRLTAIGSQTFTMRQGTFIDARAPIAFKENA
jgi:hypothetical protein